MFDAALWLKRLKIPLILLASSAAAFMVLYLFLTGDSIRRGILIENINVSGMDRDKARTLVMDNVNRRYPVGSFSLSYGGREWKFGLDEISYRFLVDDAVGKAFSIGRTGGVFFKVFKAVSLLADNMVLKIGTDYEREKLSAILSSLKSEIDTEPENAEITFVSDKIAISPGRNGSQLSIDRNLELVENCLVERNFDNIGLYVDSIIPAVAYEKVREIDTVLSHFSTLFDPGDYNRSDNIKLACSRLNGKVLLPGEVFSMNDTLGPRTVENGFKEAPVIYKNELVKGPGGGICQVTTTLYDAVLLAKLQIVERSPHSMPLGYVKPGQDATIAEDSIDFRFKNDQEYPVCLSAEVVGRRIDIRVLGRKRPEDQKIRLVSVTLEEYPPGQDETEVDDSLADGQRVVAREARKGLRVILYRETYSSDGELVDREVISEDYYKPSAALIKVNSNYFGMYMPVTKGSQNE